MAKKTLEVVEEIAAAEQARAATITNNPYFTEWVKAIREEFIVKGFLKLFYAWDGRYGRSRRRIEKFGNYILPIDMAGNKFYPESRCGWIRNEYMWFWFYLSEGQVMAHTGPSTIPEAIKTKGIPGKQILKRVVKVGKDLGIWGEEGGGVFVSPDQLDEGYLIGFDEMQRWVDSEDGYLEPYRCDRRIRWVRLFQQCEDMVSPEPGIEFRPAWFHIVSHTIFNTAIERLPVFCAVLKADGNVETLRFFDENLSAKAISYIGRFFLSLPEVIRKSYDPENLRLERRNMSWWLWHYIGNRERKKKMGYGEIARIEGFYERATVQTGIRNMDGKLRNELDGKLLQRLLLTGESLGLDYNKVYDYLAEQGIAPERDRPIDGFDNLGELI